MARDSTLPRAVAEWQLEQSRRSTGRPAFGDFSHQFAGVTSFRMLQSLTPTDAAARWLEAQDPNVRVRRLLSELRCATPTPDSVRLTTLQTYVGRRLRTIGAARTDDTTAFVLVVDSWEPATHDSFYAPPPTALRMRLTPRGWRLVPNGNLYGSRQFISVGCSSR